MVTYHPTMIHHPHHVTMYPEAVTVRPVASEGRYSLPT